MAGNSSNLAMSPHMEGRKTGIDHTDKMVKREGGTGEGTQPLRTVSMLKTLTLRENAE